MQCCMEVGSHRKVMKHACSWTTIWTRISVLYELLNENVLTREYPLPLFGNFVLEFSLFKTREYQKFYWKWKIHRMCGYSSQSSNWWPFLFIKIEVEKCLRFFPKTNTVESVLIQDISNLKRQWSKELSWKKRTIVYFIQYYRMYNRVYKKWSFGLILWFWIGIHHSTHLRLNFWCYRWYSWEVKLWTILWIDWFHSFNILDDQISLPEYGLYCYIHYKDFSAVKKLLSI